MNKREIIREGLHRGYNIAMSIDLLDIGDYGYGRFLDSSRNVKIKSENWLEFHTNVAYECESNYRELSPFEFLANDINDTEANPRVKFEPWLEFDEAIGRGINRALRERWKAILWSKKDYLRNFSGSVELFNAVWRRLKRYSRTSIDLDWNNNREVERWLDTLSSEFLNDSSSKYFVHG